MFCSCKICTDKRVASPSAIAELLVYNSLLPLISMVSNIVGFLASTDW